MLVESGLTTTSVPRIANPSPSYGILFLTGGEDPLVHTPIEREAFRTLCEAGLPAEYVECEGAGHGEATLWGIPEILDFVDARLAGETYTPPSSCEPPAATRCAGTPDGA